LDFCAGNLRQQVYTECWLTGMFVNDLFTQSFPATMSILSSICKRYRLPGKAAYSTTGKSYPQAAEIANFITA